MPDSLYDVVIIGAGPVGLTLANVMGRLKVRTLILEKERGLSGVPKALNIDDEFFRLLETVGLGDAVRAHAKYPISFDYISPTGLSLGHVEGRLTEHNYPNRAATYQPEFEKILADGALDTGFVDILFDRELEGFADRGERVEISARSESGDAFGYAGRFLVGSDGAHSSVRKLLGLPLEEVDHFDVRHVVIDVNNDIDPSARSMTQMGWRRNFFSMAAPHGRRFEFNLRKNESAEQALDDATLRRWFAPYRDYDKLDIIRKVVHAFRARLVTRMSQGRVFLIGDAAHLMPVFGSQGMNSGARDANNLGWKLARVLQDGAPAGMLDTYHDERWDAVRKTIRMAAINGKLQKVKSIPGSLLRDALFGLLRLIPPANRYIREMRYIPRPFLRSMLVRAGSETGKAQEYAGRILPNPLTFSPRDGNALLDRWIGLRFAVIGLYPCGAAPQDVEDVGRRLDAVRIDLIPRGHDIPVQRADTLTLRVEDERCDALFKHYSQQWLLIRPDRVIALAGDAQTFAREAQALLAALVDNRLQQQEPVAHIQSHQPRACSR